MILPSDDYILLSLVNTKLRDEYSSPESLCEEEGVDYSVLEVNLQYASVAQLDRARASDARCRLFESSRAHH